MNLGLQICWSNNVETLVLLGLDLETGFMFIFGFGWVVCECFIFGGRG